MRKIYLYLANLVKLELRAAATLRPELLTADSCRQHAHSTDEIRTLTTSCCECRNLNLLRVVFILGCAIVDCIKGGAVSVVVEIEWLAP